MKASERARAMIRHHEGVRQRPYRCPALLWTVGVGHVLYPQQAKLPMDQRNAVALEPQDNRIFSSREVDDILGADLQRFEQGVGVYCPVPITQGQFDAMVSFTFNVGLGTLQRSTLRQKVLRGDMDGAAEEFLKYCMAGGKILRGLQIRRQDERALFLS